MLPNFMLETPSVPRMCQSSECSRLVSTNSAKVGSFNTATRGKCSNWSVFRHMCPFRETKSDDIDPIPWIYFSEIAHEYKEIPMLIIENNSIGPIEKKAMDDQVTSKMTRNMCKSPEPTIGVDFSSNKIA